jgi:uncharacterized protein YggT (Ycf19 family)
VIRLLINIYIFILIIDAVLTYFPQYSQNQAVIVIRRLSELTTKKVRALLPPDLPYDFSWLLVILGLKIIIFLW